MKLRTLYFTTLGLALPGISMAQETAETLEAPFGNSTEPIFIIGAIIQALLGVVGAVTLLVFIWGGFTMIFAAGNEEKIKKGRTTLVWAVIGLAIILSSYAILSFIFSTLQGATS